MMQQGPSSNKNVPASENVAGAPVGAGSLPRTTSLAQRLIIGRNPKRTVLRAAVLALAAFLIFKFILLPVRISGDSMDPTYRNGGINFINRLSYRFRSPARGDVVGVRYSGESIMLLKRVVGMPGETLAIEDGVVLINGRPLEEPYVANRASWRVSARRLEADEYFLIGDNRDMPQKDHYFGSAPARRIVGKVLW